MKAWTAASFSGPETENKVYHHFSQGTLQMVANAFRILSGKLTDHHTPTFQSQIKSLNLFKLLLLSNQQFQSQIQFSFIWHQFTHGAELFYLNGETLDTLKQQE